MGSCPASGARPSFPRVPIPPWCPDPAPVTAPRFLSCPSISSPPSHPSAASSRCPRPAPCCPPKRHILSRILPMSCHAITPVPPARFSPFPCSGSSSHSLKYLPCCHFPVSPQAPHPAVVPLHVLPCGFQGTGPDPHPTGRGSVPGTGVTPRPPWTLCYEKGKEIDPRVPQDLGSGSGRVGDRSQSALTLFWSTGPLEKPLCGDAGTATALLLPPGPRCFLSVVGKREQSRHPEQKWPHGCTATAQICTTAWLPLTSQGHHQTCP